MDLQGKRLLLTGATGGLGTALAPALQRAGATLVLQGRRESALTGLRATLDGRHEIVAADLTTEVGRERVASVCLSAPFDGLINNAGVNEPGFLAELADEGVIGRVLELNLSVPMMLCRRLLPALRQRPRAAIANIGSVLGSIGYAGSAVYCATKFGLRGFSEALRRELADSNVMVFHFEPRAVATAMNSSAMVAMNEALGVAMDDPEDVANSLVTALLSDATRYRHGSPEKHLARLNAMLPQLIDKAVRGQLPVIRTYLGGERPVDGADPHWPPGSS